MVEELSKKERAVLESVFQSIKVPKKKSGRKLLVGMIGLVGSGKTLVAQKLARELGAAVVSADAIRIALRKKKTGFDNTREIMFGVIAKILADGGSVVADSDFAVSGKRNDFKKVGKDGDAVVYYVRTVRDPDVLIGDTITKRFGTKQNDLFAGAATNWKGNKKPAVVKLREMWRRTPHHYSWSHDDGGQWVQKTIPQVYATVDTTKVSTVPKQVREVAKRLRY